jgi:uncharacterized protein (DUF169 family)
MSINKDYAQQFKEMGYKRKIIAFKLSNEIPENTEDYGEDMSFLCAISVEPWEEGRKPFYITNKNSLCGGPLYAGIGNRKIDKEEFDGGMSQTLGEQRGYESRDQFRRVNQQVSHTFLPHKYLIIGLLEDIEEPDLVMVVTEAYRIMRLCKAYTWKTGELVQGLSGSAWCTCSFPHVYETKTMSFATGDEQSRILMGLEEGELSCLIHWETLPIIMENYKNIQTGLMGI